MTKRMRGMAGAWLVVAMWTGGAAAARADTIGTFQWARCADDGSVTFGSESFEFDCLLGGGAGSVFAVRNFSTLDFKALEITSDNVTLASSDDLPALPQPANWIVVVPGFLGPSATLSFSLVGGLPPGYSGIIPELPQVDEANLEVALNLVPVPEPATLTFLLLGAAGGAATRARRRAHRASGSHVPR